MRLWSIHPKYLDTKGLVALWREGLLAKAVLENKTKGYRNHPQIIRFLRSQDPDLAINTYLKFILEESLKRGFNFDASKLKENDYEDKIPVTRGQIEFEFKILQKKINIRSPERTRDLESVTAIEAHPLFYIVEGDIESWEKASASTL